MYKVSLQKVLRELGRREVRFGLDDAEEKAYNWTRPLINALEQTINDAEQLDYYVMNSSYLRSLKKNRNILAKVPKYAPLREIEDLIKEYSIFSRKLKAAQNVCKKAIKDVVNSPEAAPAKRWFGSSIK